MHDKLVTCGDGGCERSYPHEGACYQRVRHVDGTVTLEKTARQVSLDRGGEGHPCDLPCTEEPLCRSCERERGVS